MKVKFSECIDLCGKSVDEYKGEKQYISTSAVNCNFVDEMQIEKFLYKDKPSRANLQTEENSVIFAKMQNTKKTLIINKELSKNIYSTGFFAVKPKNNMITVDCLFYLLNSEYFLKLKDKNCSGATQKAITNEGLEKIEINIPKTEEQEILIKKLKSLENIINLYQFQLQNLDHLIKSRFVEMFGKRLEKEQILLNEIADFTIGLTYKPENISENGTIVLRSGNIQNNSLQIVEDVVRVEGVKIPENKYIKKNDILMCSRNGSARLVGKSCLITEMKEKMSFGAFMTVIRSKYPYFLQSFFNSDYFKEQLTSVATTSVNQITTYMLNGYKTIKPTDDEEKEFSDFVKQVDKSKFVENKAKLC